MKKTILVFLLFLATHLGFSQLNSGTTMVVGRSYWGGIKIGGGLVLNQYQDPKYKDSYNFNSKPSYNAGIVFAVSGSDNYGLHTELNYEKRFRKVRNEPGADIPDIVSDATFEYISLPIMMQFRKILEPKWAVFAAAGPQISTWIGGKTKIESDELREFSNSSMVELEYLIKKSPKEGPPDVMYLPNANRFQLGLVFAVGTMFEFQEYRRITLDARLLWNHTNLAFNEGNTDILVAYDENLEFRQHSLTVNLSYTLGYDPQFAKKGKSTFKPPKRRKKF
jgi:hypothetical protein